MIKRHPQGIVLFQVLVIVAVFSMLVLLAVAASQQAIRQTQQMQQSVEQQLALYSARNHFLLALLTNQRMGEAATANGWNFYGQPFDWALPATQAFLAVGPSVRVINQDEAGLLSVHAPGDAFKTLLAAQGLSSSRVNELFSTLKTAQQAYYRSTMLQNPRSDYPYLYIQSAAELAALPGWDFELVQRLQPFIVFENLIFNPASAPDPLLRALLPAAQADIIANWRAASEFTLEKFSALTGIYGDEVLSLYPGNTIQLTLISSQNSASLSSRVTIDPYHPVRPVVIHAEHQGGSHEQ